MSGPRDVSSPSASDRPVRRSIKSARVSVAPERVSAASTDPGASELKGKFDLHGLLGEGGMGSVFIAQDRRLGRVVALKVLRSEYDRDADLLRRFALEAQVGAQLEHPNIVPLYSLERAENGGPAFAMQLVEGTTMAQYMWEAAAAARDARGPSGEYALKKRLAKLLGACDAMQFAHSRGVIHRDLKPENIMLGAHHEVYVMDWGLARVTVGPSSDGEGEGVGSTGPTRSFDLSPTMLPSTPGTAASVFDRAATVVRPADGKVHETAATMLSESAGRAGAPASAAAQATQVGMVMGTYQYMPPEQAMGLLDQVGPAVDQFALGLILLELASLIPARSAVSMAEAQREALLNQYRADDDVDGRPLDPALLAIVRRATETEVGARYASVDALAEDVRRFIRDEPVSVYREGLSKRALRLAARRPIAVMSALAAVLIMGAALVIASLAQSAATARRAADDLQGLKRLLVAVQSRAHEVDVYLSDVSVSLERVEAVARELLGHAGKVDPAALKTIAAEPLPELKWSERSQAPMNYRAELVTWAGRGHGELPPVSMPTVKRVAPWLRDALIATLPPEILSSAGEPEAAVEAGKAPLVRVCIGLSDGAYAQYPARGLPDGYDVRKRQWYRMAISSHGLGWHAPIAAPEGKTLRLPALVAIRRGQEVLGAVAGDLIVEEFAQQLLLEDMPGFIDAYLVSAEGQVTVRRGLASEVLKGGVVVDRDIVLPRLTDAALAARIAAGEKGGYVESAGRLTLFVKLVSPAWYYVAEFERAPYLSREARPGGHAFASLAPGTEGAALAAATR